MHLVKRLLASVVLAGWLLPALSAAAVASDADVRAFLTYAVFAEVRAANKASKLTAPAARQISAAAASMEMNRSTSLASGACAATTSSDGNAATDWHGFVPSSFRLLPVLYPRDFVRGTLIGATDGANAVLADAKENADAKARVVGEVVHLAQDIALNQTGSDPSPFIVGDAAPEAERWLVQDGTLTDGALRALVQTLALARALDRSGALPPVPALDAFVRDTFVPASASSRAALVKALRDAGVYRYVEAVTSASEPAATRNRRGASIWAAAHPSDAQGFTPPDLSPGNSEIVNFDTNPAWLLPSASRRSGETSRLVIDDKALAQQALAQLREAIARLRAASPEVKDAAQAARLEFMLDASVKSADQADAQLKQAASARSVDERQSALAQAQRILMRAIKDTENGTSDIALPTMTSRGDCAPPSGNISSSDARIARIAALITDGALARVGDVLPATDRETCASVTRDAVTALFTRKPVSVPAACLSVVLAARDALQNYARVHTDTYNPAIERVLADLARL